MGGTTIDNCLKLLFILLPQYKASKLSFICGETVTTPAQQRGVVGTALHAIMVRIAAAPAKISFYSPTTLYIDLFSISYNYEHFLLIFLSFQYPLVHYSLATGLLRRVISEGVW